MIHRTETSFRFSCSAYPVVWALCEGTGRLSADTEVLLFGILDVIAKPVWGLWIVLAIPSVSLSHQKAFWSFQLTASLFSCILLSQEGHVLLPEWATAPSGSVGGGSYGAVPQHDGA